MPQKYMVIADHSLEHLEHTVNSKIEKGGQCIGGVCVVAVTLDENQEPSNKGNLQFMYYHSNAGALKLYSHL